MAFRTWARVLWAALCVGALAGAGQLGVAYGLRLVRIDRTFEVTVRDQWAAQLTWVSWFAMVAAVAGALAGGRLATRDLRRLGGGAMAALAVVGALGAAVVVPLTMLPARTAQVVGVEPVAAVALCALLGTVLGAGAGYAALAYPVARWSLGTVAAAVWVIGIGAVLPSLGRVNPQAVRLGVLDLGALAATQRAALLTMPALALVTGAGLGWLARRQGRSLLTVGLAGLPGPALLTLGYLIAGPGSGRYQQVPYWAAMLALGAGALGSVLAAVIRRGDEPGTGTPSTGADTDDADAGPADTAPTDASSSPSAKPLPRRIRPTDTAPGDDSAGPGRATARPPSTTTDQLPTSTDQSPTTARPSRTTGAVRRTPRRGGSTAAPVSPGAATSRTPAAGPAPTSAPRPGPAGPTPTSAPRPGPAGPTPTSAPRPAPTATTPPPSTPVRVSPPLPTPTPASAPLPPPRPTGRRPGAASGDETDDPTAADRGRAPRTKPLRPKDEEYVDWVTGLGDDSPR